MLPAGHGHGHAARIQINDEAKLLYSSLTLCLDHDHSYGAPVNPSHETSESCLEPHYSAGSKVDFAPLL